MRHDFFQCCDGRVPLSSIVYGLDLISLKLALMAPIYNEEHREWASRKIVAIAKSIISGDLGIVAGARQLAGWRFDVDAENDSDFLFFLAVDSETDDLPVGEVRSRWNPEALKAKDAELQKFETSVRNRAIEACHSLIRKYEQPSNSRPSLDA